MPKISKLALLLQRSYARALILRPRSERAIRTSSVQETVEPVIEPTSEAALEKPAILENPAQEASSCPPVERADTDGSATVEEPVDVPLVETHSDAESPPTDTNASIKDERNTDESKTDESKGRNPELKLIGELLAKAVDTLRREQHEGLEEAAKAWLVEARLTVIRELGVSFREVG